MASPLDTLFDLRPGEGRQVVRVGSAFSAILAAHTILETARDAMFLTKLPPSRLAIVYAAMAVISLIAIAFNTRMVRRLGRRNALIATLMASAYGTTLFYVAHDGAVAVAGLYLWAGLLGTLTIVQYWLLAGQLFTVTQGKRLFGPIAAIGAMGAFAGAWSASALLMKVSVQQLLPVSAGLYLLAAGLLTLGADGPAVAPPELRSQAEQTRSAMTHLRDQPYVRRLATLIALVTAAALVADYLFKASAALALEPDRLPGFFARYYGVVAAVSLLLQLLGTGWLVKRMGVLASLTLLPLALLMGSAATVLLGGIFTAVILTKGADGTLRNSVNRVSTEVLWMPLAPAVREAAREPIDSVLMRVVQAVTALALFGLAFTGHDTPVVLAAVLGGFAAAWLVAAVSLRSLYLDKLRQALARPAFDADQDLDLTSAEVVVEALSSSDPKRVTAAIGLLAAHNRTRLIPALILHHESPEVLRAALDVVASPDRRDWVPLASRLLSHAEAPVRTAAVRALARAGQALPMASLLSDADPAVRAHATFWQARASGGDPAEDPRVREVLGDDSSTGRAAKLALLEALRDDGDTAWTGVVAELLRHGDAAVLEQAAQAVERVPDPRFLPVLIERLGVRTGRASVRAALVRVGEPALDALQAAYTDPATPIRVRLHLPKTIAMFGSQRACDFLLSRIGGDGDGAIRYRALRALVRLVVHNPVQVDRRPVLIEMQSNLREHFRTLALMRALDQGGKAGTGDGGQLIRGLLDDKQKQAMDRVFLLLQIAHRNEDVGGLRAALDSPDRTVRAHALEFLDALTRSPTYARTEAAGLQELLLLAVDDHPDDEKLARATAVADAPSGPREALARLLRDGDEVVAAIAAFHALELGEVVLRDDVLEVARERPILEPLGFAAAALGVPRGA
jgi:AAA family ATP:ADP antiporter